MKEHQSIPKQHKHHKLKLSDSYLKLWSAQNEAATVRWVVGWAPAGKANANGIQNIHLLSSITIYNII